MQMLRFLPIIGLQPLILLWFGIGELSKIFLIFYTTIFLVLLNTMIGVTSVRRNQVRAAQCFGATAWQRYAWVVLPATMPYILTGMRLAMGNCFQTVVAAELIAAERGIGFDRRPPGCGWPPTGCCRHLTLGLLGVLADFLFQVVTRLYARRYLMAR